ncbi:MAG: hypothetical protein AAB495_00145 [Patescibacteria group bacterium]
MEELLQKLGIDWKLLLSQAANFLLLLVILRIFAYKPLLKLLKERREKIEEGVQKAEEADTRLGEADKVLQEKTKEAEIKSLEILKSTEARSREVEAEMLAAAKRKELVMFEEVNRSIAQKEEDMKVRVRNEAIVLVKEALTQAVGMKPKEIDEALIEQALQKTARK